MLKIALIGGIITLVIVATTAEIVFPPKPVLLYNPTDSAPIGWYRLHKNAKLTRGTQIAAYAPDWARVLADERHYLPYDYPLIKTILAISGDKVCYHKNRMSVPNWPDIPVQTQDSLGRDMPVKSGCITLTSGQFLIVSPDVQAGFDSRYFGPIERQNILGKVTYLGNVESAKSSKSGGLGG